MEAVGDGDVVSDTSGATLAAVAALVEAVGDTIARRPGVVRKVEGKPAAPRKKSRLGAIREDEYQFNVHNVRWSLDDGEVLDLAVVGNGRYLGRVMKSEFPRYVRPLDLLDVPKGGWRKALEPLFESMDDSAFEPVSAFPWVDSLFVGPQAATIWLGEIFNPFGPGWSFTTNLEGVAEYNSAIIHAADGAVLAELHAEAIGLGWQISDVELRNGLHGEYQEIVLIRKGFEVLGVSSASVAVQEE